jgi:FkbM family methyltransferase
MTIVSILKFITSHPLNRKNKTSAVIRFFKWQVNARLNPFPVIYPFTERSKLIIQKGMTGATGNLYCGLHEYHDMFFLLHFLRKEDLFVDIGANVGSYSVLASAHVGSKVISIEPVPKTFSTLTQNILINQVNGNVTLLNVAAGSKKDTLKFTSSFDTVNHVVASHEKVEDVIDVKVDKLDSILNSDIPALIKIDVEGFETEVIKGASHVLKENKLKAIIIELNGSGERYGYSEVEIHNTFLNLGFAPYSYDPVKRELNKLNGFGSLNTIYIRDEGFVKDRVRTAEKVKVLNTAI